MTRRNGKLKIRLDPKNARRHGDRNKAMIRESLEAVGPLRSIGVDGDDVIRAGNGVFEQAEALGLKVRVVDAKPDELIAVRRKDLRGKKAVEAALYDNRAGETSEWDADVLAEIARRDGDLIARLFEGDRNILAAIAPETEPGDAEPQIDRVEELQEKWQTARGQSWRMGNHTLFVGDAASAHIECNFAIYDPPFDWSAQQQDNALSWVKWNIGALLGLHRCMPLAARSDWIHWWVWDSATANFGGKGYHPSKTCAIVLAFGEKKSFFPYAALRALDRAGIEHFDYPAQVVRIVRPIAQQEHVEEKPYSLADYIISLYSRADDVVGDPFAGSGVFLIACENLGRKYIGSEISPGNCAVILDRWARTFPDMPPSLA